MPNFGDVLRGLGSVLNPQVNTEVEAEDQQRRQQQSAIQSIMLNRLMAGAESGAIPADRLPPQLQGIVGPTPQVKRELELRRAMENLTPEQRQNPEMLKSLFLQYADPKEALTALYRNQMEGQPEIVKLQNIEAQYRRAGNLPAADQIRSRIEKLNQTENSQTQEMMGHILKVKQQIANGQQVSPEDRNKATLYYRFLNTPRMDQSGAVMQPSLGNEFDPSTGFGRTPAATPGGVPGGPAPTPIPGGRGFVIPGQVKPGEGEIKVLSEADALKGHLKDLKELYQPDFVGPLAGRFGDVKGATVGNSPEQARFRAQVALYKDRTIKFITGAQMGEAETKRLIKEIPDDKDPPTEFLAKLEKSEQNNDYVVRAYQQNMAQGGIRTVGGNSVQVNTNAKGWKLMKDAKGNRAYVSPDGKNFEPAQ